MLSALSGVNDIRNIKEGDTSFSTEFMDSADATAQGGTLTLQQALATEVNVESFMERTGLFTDKDGNLLTSRCEPKLKLQFLIKNTCIGNFQMKMVGKYMLLQTPAEYLKIPAPILYLWSSYFYKI